MILYQNVSLKSPSYVNQEGVVIKLLYLLRKKYIFFVYSTSRFIVLARPAGSMEVSWA
jgi:hypothetical protein